MCNFRILLQQLLCVGLLCAVVLRVAAQGGASSEEETGLSPKTYSSILDTIHVLSFEEVVELLGEEIERGFTQEEQKAIANTLQQMRYRGKGTRSFYRAYFQSIEVAISSGRATGSSLSRLLKTLESAATVYNPRDYRRLLRFLVRFFNTGIIYTAPKQQWQLQKGGEVDFSFETAEGHVLTTEEKPLLADAQAAATDKAPNPSPPPNEADQSDNDDSWGSSDDSDDGWGYDEGEVDLNSQRIDDWGATEVGSTLEWGKVKNPYEQKATAFDEKELYNQISVLTQPLPLFEGGAIMHIEDVQLKLKTPGDSLLIGPLTGRFSILSKQLETTALQMPWPGQSTILEDVGLRTDRMEMHLPSGRIQAEKAHLKVPIYLESEVEGIFQAYLRTGGDLYPVFRSLASDLSPKMPYTEVSYKGGITLRDSLLFGESAAALPGELRIGSDTSVYLDAKSSRFAFGSEHIYSKKAEATIYHSIDSLYHPQMELKYAPDSVHLLLIRHNPYHHSPFFSSYLDMYIQADVLDWDRKTDSLLLYVLAGKSRVPAVFESATYFSNSRYRSIGNMWSFHPLLLVARFAKEAKMNTFLLSDVVAAYGVSMEQLKAGVQFLHEQRYLDYDDRIGVIRIREKTFHYAFSALGYRDYDHLVIPSLLDSARENASLHFTKNEMLVRGVRRVNFTPDLRVYAEPEGGTLRLQKGKNFSFDGKVNSGTILYSGKDFDFNHEGYKINMAQIDSMVLQVNEADTLIEEGELNTQELINGELNTTSGTLYIAPPGNLSAKRPAPSYPRFGSESDSDIYFDDPRILGGVYDKTVKFVAPPFDVDSINDPGFTVVGFDGAFHAGTIMLPITQKLSIMEDKTLGFTHKIEDKSGYPLYGLPNSYVHGQLRLDLGGLQDKGQLEHQTTTLQSDKFTFYLDKTVADVSEGNVRPGSVSGLEDTSYPKVSFKNVRLLWQPHKDNMLIKTKVLPMSLYDDVVDFKGTLNIKSTAAYASGTIDSDVVHAESGYFHFKETEYAGRQVNFEVASSDPEKPAVRGKRIELRYDLKKSIGYLQPERPGIPSIDFPYLQMKTSMYEAVWDKNARNVKMSRPEGVSLEQSFFTSTKPEMEELSFQAEKAVYSMDSSQLRAEGVPYIRALGVDIIPKDNRVLVGPDSDIQELQQATLYVDAENRNHTLVNGTIKIHSANHFTGSADYKHTNVDSSVYYIRLDRFLTERAKGDDGKTKEVVVSGGVVPEEQRFKASTGFYFKGNVKMFANRKRLLFDGFVKLVLEGEDRNTQWIMYKADTDEKQIIIDFDNSTTEDGTPLTAGLHYKKDGELYLSFMQDKEDPEDIDIFESEGTLSYDTERNFYVISAKQKKKRKRKKEAKSKDESEEEAESKDESEEEAKSKDESEEEAESKDESEEEAESKDESEEEAESKDESEKPEEQFSTEPTSYTPKTFMYSPRTENVLFEGPLRLLGSDRRMRLLVAARGKANLQEKVYELEAAAVLDANLPKKAAKLLAQQLKDASSYVEVQAGKLPFDFYDLVSFLIGEKATRRYEEKKNLPLYEASKKLRSDFMFSRLRLKWDPIRYAWYSQGALQLSHMHEQVIGTDLQGYLQIQPSRTGGNIDMLIYLSPTVWYHLRYKDRNLSLYSGISNFNSLIGEQTKGRTPVLGSYSFTKGRAGWTDSFVQAFASRYRDGQDPLNMKYPDPVLPDRTPNSVPSWGEEDSLPTEESDRDDE